MIGGITTVEGDSNATFPFYMLSDLWDNQSNGSASDHEQVARHAANQQRTSKARTAAVLSKFKRKIQKQGFPQDDDGSGVYPTCLQTDDSWSARIQQNYFTPLVNDAANRTRKAFGDSDRRKVFRERGRAVMSFLCQLPGMLKRMLRPSTADASQCSPESVIDCVVLDDTSTILRGSDGMPTVHSVMNTIQTIHTSFSNGSRESAQVPTPCICLPTQKTEDVFLGYAAGVLLSSQGVGTIMESLDKKSIVESGEQDSPTLEALIGTFKWKVHIFVGDALPTNTAVFKLERRLQRQALQSGGWGILSLRIKCVLHQVCLVRRPAVLSVDRFWATLVRLAHLFEQHSFKRQFTLAVVQILRSADGFQRSLTQCLEA